MATERRKLNPIHVIAIRLALWPLFQALRCLLCLVLLIGWGKHEATDIWEELA